MSNLTIFNFNQSPVKLLIENNKPFFNLIDVCDVFDIQNPRRVLSEMLDSEGVRQAYTLAKDNKKRRLAFISEPNLYRIIFRSDKPIAVDFQNWVFDELLPTIRKTGSYSLTINPEQQQMIKQAVNERAFRTGEKHQGIYQKLYTQFKIPKYQDLPASKFNDVIKWLGGLSDQSRAVQFTDDELCELAWVIKYADNARRTARELYPILKFIKCDLAPTVHDIGHELSYSIEQSRKSLNRETQHVISQHDNWRYVLPTLRRLPF